jgi:ABC-2 type transport system ATP-binding protein
MVIEGQIDTLSREALAGGRFLIELEIAEPKTELAGIIGKVPGVENIEVEGNIFKISTNADLRSQISRVVVESSALLVQMKLHEFSLDDIYMKYFKEDKELHNVGDTA